MKVEIKLIEGKDPVSTESKIRLLISSYPQFVSHVRQPKKPRNPTEEDFILYEAEMDAYREGKRDRDKKRLENELIREAIDKKIESIMRKSSGLSKVPKQYREKVWSQAFRDGYNSGYEFVYITLCELVRIFE